jgi:tetratricopeptide (TPR) repeat protein
MHQFLGLVLFAQGKYEQAAAPIYSVLSVGPGWDWTSLIGNYNDANVYTEQLRALESYCNLNPQSAPARFVLAYFYLTQGNTDSALGQLKQVIAVVPKDTVSAQLIQRLEKTGSPTGPGAADQPPATAPTPELTPTTLTAPAGTGKEGRLEGTWTAQADPDTAITLAFLDGGKFTWKIAHKGQDRTIQGKLTSGNGLLTLAQDRGAPMVGNLTWTDETHFAFRVPGAPAEHPGLHFVKAP